MRALPAVSTARRFGKLSNIMKWPRELIRLNYRQRKADLHGQALHGRYASKAASLNDEK
jgi:hypothetical protein